MMERNIASSRDRRKNGSDFPSFTRITARKTRQQ
jgi:hypothetical protein